ncbi:MAG: LPS-assembly protein LptD [Burkholderiaceae bacterium]
MPFKPLWPLLAFSPVFLLGSFSWAAECRLGASPSFVKPALLSPEDPTGLARGKSTSSPDAGLGFSETGQLGLLPLRLDPRLNLQPSGAQTPAYLFGRALDGQFQDRVRMEGGAALRQLGFSLKAKQLTMDMVPNRLIAEGEVTLFREGELYKGPELSLDLGTQQGWFRDVSYEFSSLKATGQAERIDFIQPGEVVLSNASFTTCPVDRPAWRLESKTLAVDQVREMASSQGSQLYWGDTPLLPLGDLTFPIGRERKSGVLPPLYRVTSNLGLELEVPYYWNIAPNRDMTLSPRLIQRRGLMLGAEARFLEEDAAGVIDLDFLPSDKVRDQDRHRLEMQLAKELGSDVWLELNGARVSDDNYFEDFGGSLLGSSRRVLPVTLGLQTKVSDWHLRVQAQEFQVLQDPELPILAPYSWLPRFMADRTGSRAIAQPLLGGMVNRMNWQASLEATAFDHATLATGERLVAQLAAELPARIGVVDLVPRLRMHATRYAHRRNGDAQKTSDRFYQGVVNPSLGVFQSNVGTQTESYTRFIPTVSLDASTVLEKSLSLNGSDDTIATIEPRALYVYSPYKDQSDLPVFDSAQPTVSFAQILSDRVFTGHDRVADQDHLTTALTARLLDAKTGEEQLRGSVAQRFYFSSQQVVLPGQTPRKDMESDLFAEGGFSAFDDWRFDAVGQYTARQSRWQGGALTARYEPRPGYSAFASYRFVRDAVNVVDLAFQAPVAKNWYAVGRYSHSLAHTENGVQVDAGLVEAIAGFEYDGGCWVGRAVLQQFATAARETNTAVFLQLELNGIARVGTDPLQLLRRSIPSYRMVNQLAPGPARFENFQ